MPKLAIRIAFFALASAVALTIAGCHSAPAPAASPVVLGHPATPEFVVSNPPVATKAAEMPSMDKHAAHSVSCEQCHGEAVPTAAPASNKSCLGCHKQEALVKATLQYDDRMHKSQNPHDSHMHGVSCMVCHHNHSASVLACDQCHKPPFGWKVP